MIRIYRHDTHHADRPCWIIEDTVRRIQIFSSSVKAAIFAWRKYRREHP